MRASAVVYNEVVMVDSLECVNKAWPPFQHIRLFRQVRQDISNRRLQCASHTLSKYSHVKLQCDLLDHDR